MILHIGKPISIAKWRNPKYPAIGDKKEDHINAMGSDRKYRTRTANCKQ
jgi:hypothetical protein